MKLSVVIPVYNSEATINSLVSSLFMVLDAYKLEVVLVNDCSKDNSAKICESIARKNSRVKFISLRKNSGEHNAVMCGLNYATGEYVAIMDDDFQNPPSEVIRLLHTAQDGHFDVVYGKYEEKQHNLYRNLGSQLHNYLTVFLLGKPKKLYLSSFKILHRDLVQEIIGYKGPFPYIDALVLRSTDNIGTVTVKHASRENGKSNYTFKKLFSLYLNVFINYSNKPLRLITIFGITISVLSFIASIDIIYEKLFLNNVTPGWSFLALISLFSIGLIFIVLGVLGEYLGKILMSLNQQPQFVVKKEMNTGTLTETVMETVMETEYDRKTIRV